MYEDKYQALDPAICRRARLSRDRRFDGEFFLAVKTTGIYCRPVCPARAPAERNVAYFRSATQAANAGYRPCLRCRPESAAGFGSLRRFNSTFRERLKLTPGELRRQGAASASDSRLALQLAYRPPYDWGGVIGFFARHAVEGVEQVTPDSYWRRFRTESGSGSFSVSPMPGRHALRLQVDHDDLRELMPLVARVRRMFDLDANPGTIQNTLGTDETLAPLLQAAPGVRAPGYGSPFEAAVRAATHWRPWRSYAANLLWRSLKP